MKDAEVSHVYISSMNRNALRAPEANEMLERPPSRMFRMGAWSVVMLFVLLFIIGEFVKYPDTLEGSAVITTDPLPIKLKTPSAGRIISLFVADGALIQKNTPIAELENPTGYENIQKLETTMDNIYVSLQTSNNEALADLLTHPLPSLGDAQGFYNQLLQELSAKLLLRKEQLYHKRTENLQQQISKLQSISQIANHEKNMIEEELKQADVRFKANEQLYKEKVISQQEYYDEAARLRNKKLQLEQQNASIIQNHLNSGENSRQMLEIQYEREEKERGFNVGIREAMRNITNYIQTWRQRYLIIAPYTGTINYLRPLQINEPVNSGDELFAIVPSKHNYVAVIMLPPAGIGKIQIGQKVHLMVDNFPYNEFGFLEGKVSKRSSMQEAGEHGTSQPAMYRVYVQLNDTLQTNYHKLINFSPEMTANARVITKDRNLLQRFVAGMAKSVK
jgi:multidrug efflux pump subunit AcrA (membrane-fusion protein)